MQILIDNPREVGADRIVNAIAAFEQYKQACIVVDFGTATTFDVINSKGQYLGGVIAPGIGISADALFTRAAKLPRVEITRPPSVLGKSTVLAIQSGLVFGYVSLVEGLVTRLKAELNEPTTVIATGGLAPLIARETTCITAISEFLTLDGLRLVLSATAKNKRNASWCGATIDDSCYFCAERQNRHHRDLRFHPRRIDARRAPVHVCAFGRLPVALPLVRHGIQFCRWANAGN